MSEAQQPTHFDVIIVGAGFGGLYQLYRAREAGLRVTVVDSAGGIGGTWYWNRYPGCRCDIESIAYSYSFSSELQQEWTWTEKYATQPEILAYINYVADRFDLRRDITLNTYVESAHFDERSGNWRIFTRDEHGEWPLNARFLIMATGCLSVPKRPEIPGIEGFQGKVYNTAYWPNEEVDFNGQRVGIIGTGASGIQATPEIAKQAAELTVFQRTPHYAIPAQNRMFTDADITRYKENYPEFRAAARISVFGFPVDWPEHSALEVGPGHNAATFQAAWEKGTIIGMLASYNDILYSRESNERAAEFIRGKIREIVHNQDVAESLCPYEYALGSRRLPLETDYYETFNSEHVRLVDVRTNPIQEVTQGGVHTAEGEIPLDVLVLATGFDAMTGALTAIDIRGRNGVSLKECWEESPDSYLGLAMAGFPNLFTITGPGSPSVLSNMVFAVEQHADWITDAITHLDRNGLTTIEATKAAQDSWRDHVKEVSDQTVYADAYSWYTGANIDGKKRVFMVYIGGFGAYTDKCDEVAANGYEGFEALG